MSDIIMPVVLRSDCDLGQIDFINCLPITWLLRKEKPDHLRLVMGSPGDLNKQYQQKKLDLGAMSSHYFLQDRGFELFPNISISSKGAVGSVLFFSKEPLDRLAAERNSLIIAVPEASASSVRLLHILLLECYGLTPEFIAVADPRPDQAGPGDNEGNQSRFDAYLLFGDSALTTDARLESTGLVKNFERRDLGQWWFEKYQLPMVFGVWAARRSWIERNRDDFRTISAYLAGTYGKGLGPEFQGVVSEAAERTGLSPARLSHYYTNELDFSFGDEHAAGLGLYDNLCKKHNLL